MAVTATPPGPTQDIRPVRRALISVFDKTGLEDLVRGLHDQEVDLVSTGGSAALIESLGLPVTKVEDLTGSIEVLFCPKTYQTISTFLAEDTVVEIRGRVNRRDDTPSIYGSELTIMDVSADGAGPVALTLASNRCTTELVTRLKRVLQTHPGGSEVRVHLTQPGRETLVKLDDAWRVEPSPALFGDLKALLGPACLARGRQ